VTPAALGAVVVGTGPGAYTGLRVGLVTRRRLGRGARPPAYGVCSLDGIAALERGVGDLLVLTDARAKEFYWARYDTHGDRVDGPKYTRPRGRPRSTGVTPSSGPVRGLLPGLGRAATCATATTCARPIWCASPRRVLVGAPSDPLTPLYLRRPDAGRARRAEGGHARDVTAIVVR